MEELIALWRDLPSRMNPNLLEIGSFQLRYYSLMYLAAFAAFLLLGRVRIRQPHIAAQGWKKEDLDDMLFYGMLGVVIGGRLGEVLFYQPEMLLTPLEVFKIWKGGMSFHGGFLGVLIAMALWARRAKRNLLDVYDFIAPLVPLGYAAGRIGNFINAELPGRVADASLPWAMRWPDLRYPLWPEPVFLEGLRHPSPLYQMAVDGLLVFVILWLFARKARPRLAVGAMFTLLYGCARFFTEYFRVPDWQVTVAGLPVTSGQMLSLPMIVAAIAMLAWAYSREARQAVRA
jgi:phosphatidylglycerol:prolipoprotein diacylglycerol transferase